jgi:hypothetical protein
MSVSSNLNPQVEILKSLGHKSRTLLNGITGPVQIIRSLSDEPRLIEPLRMLELTVSRFEKFSFRSLMLSELIRNKKVVNLKTFELIDTFRYVTLDFTDLLDFYNLKIELQNDKSQINITSDYDLLSHCIMIIFEHIISLSNDGSTIKVDFNKGSNYVECTFSCIDNGMVYKSLNTAISSPDYPSDIDLYLLKFGIEILKAKLGLSLSSDKQSAISLEIPYQY